MDPRRLDEAWDFADPAASEVRLRALMCAVDGVDRQVAATHVARSLGLQERYDEALDLLDVLPEDACREVRVRALLERGRVQRSRGVPDATLFDQAVALAAGRGMESLHVDALHMAALVEPDVVRRIQVTEAALAIASVATDQRARDWDASLLNNLGMAHYDAGDLSAALCAFEAALAARVRIGVVADVRVARWMVGWALRLLGRCGEALCVQEALAADLAAGGECDPYVDEELAILQG